MGERQVWMNGAMVSESEARLHVVNAQGYLEPLHPKWDPARSVMLRSEFPTAYNPFNLHVFRHAGYVERGAHYMGKRVVPIVEHKVTGIDIHDEQDFQVAEALMAATPRPDFLRPYIHEP